MAKSRKFLTVSALGVAAFALIGAGASATFQDSVTAQQTITAGTMNVTIAGSNGWSQPDGKTLTLPAFGPTGSTFSTGAQSVTVTNNGNIDAKLVSIEVSAPTNGNTALLNNLRINIGGVNVRSAYDGLFNGLESAANTGIHSFTIGTLAKGQTWEGRVTFYANDLPDGAQGAVVVPTLKVNFTG